MLIQTSWSRLARSIPLRSQRASSMQSILTTPSAKSTAVTPHKLKLSSTTRPVWKPVSMISTSSICSTTSQAQKPIFDSRTKTSLTLSTYASSSNLKNWKPTSSAIWVKTSTKTRSSNFFASPPSTKTILRHAARHTGSLYSSTWRSRWASISQSLSASQTIKFITCSRMSTWTSSSLTKVSWSVAIERLTWPLSWL